MSVIIPVPPFSLIEIDAPTPCCCDRRDFSNVFMMVSNERTAHVMGDFNAVSIEIMQTASAFNLRTFLQEEAVLHTSPTFSYIGALIREASLDFKEGSFPPITLGLLRRINRAIVSIMTPEASSTSSFSNPSTESES